MNHSAPSDLISPLEAAGLLSVDPKTVSRWADAGKISSIRTGGGHRRFLRSEIIRMRDLDQAPPGSWTTSHARASGPGPVGVERSRDDTSERPGSAVLAAEAVALAASLQAEQVSDDVVRRATAVERVAELTATTAARLREGRLLAAEKAARAEADDAARTATEVKIRADHSARLLSEAAAIAAALVSAAQTSGRDPAEVARAVQVAATVRDAAAAAAQESVEAATRVASAVAAAAAVVAAQVSAADIAIESEVARLAVAVQALATAEARITAAQADERASATATVAREAAAALRREGIEPERPTPPAAPAPNPATVPAGGSGQYAIARSSPEPSNSEPRDRGGRRV